MIGEWCSRGAHDACKGHWRGEPCRCECHTEANTIDLIESSVNLTVNDKKTLRAFAAFLRYAGKVGDRKVTLHPEWYAYMTGAGPCPDPESEVGPDDRP